jgi:hypothetical protein
MSVNVKVKARVATAVVATLAVLVFAAPAPARTYTIVSCNSAFAFGYNANAWVPFVNAGTAYETCPSNGGFTAGVSNRLTGRYYNGYDYSGHAFTAPPGTTLTQVRWGGRLARGGCNWGTFLRALPSAARVFGWLSGEYCKSTDLDNTTSPFPFNLPAGTTRLEQVAVCGAPQCAPGAAIHGHVLDVTVDDPQPPSISLSGRLVSGEWVSGRTGVPPDLAASATDSSGIAAINWSLEGESRSEPYGCDWSRVPPCPVHAATSSAPSVAQLSDGHHTLQATATDAAGNTASATGETYVDNTPPDPIVPDVAGGSGWRQTNEFAVSWTNHADGAAPITKALWKLCGSDGSCPVRGERSERSIHELDQIRLPAPGEYRLQVWLEDAAGNQREGNAAVSVPLRFDPEPPVVAFVPPDPADPLRVTVNAADRYSGLAAGEIEMRAVGSSTWHGLPTNSHDSQLIAYVDDERFRRGVYEFRAHAEDRAGNEASTTTRTDGATASLRLPARIETRLRVGIPDRPRRSRHTTRFLDRAVASYGRAIHLRGRLQNVDGQPLDGASIEALEVGPDGAKRPIGLATTGSRGKFRYVLRANRNRDIQFRYPGSRRIGAATQAFALRVRGSSSIAASDRTVRNGESVAFSGRVTTRPIPPLGKLLEMQAHFRGRWRTFSTLRTDGSGRWRFPYRFGATLGRVIYRFRVRLPSEGGYPFTSGNSRVAKVVVFGS